MLACMSMSFCRFIWRYARPRKYKVFSRLALNDYFIFYTIISIVVALFQKDNLFLWRKAENQPFSASFMAFILSKLMWQ